MSDRYPAMEVGGDPVHERHGLLARVRTVRGPAVASPSGSPARGQEDRAHELLGVAVGEAGQGVAERDDLALLREPDPAVVGRTRHGGNGLAARPPPRPTVPPRPWKSRKSTSRSRQTAPSAAWARWSAQLAIQ
jgi:hypothetical protein